MEAKRNNLKGGTTKEPLPSQEPAHHQPHHTSKHDKRACKQALDVQGSSTTIVVHRRDQDARAAHLKFAAIDGLSLTGRHAV